MSMGACLKKYKSKGNVYYSKFDLIVMMKWQNLHSVSWLANDNIIVTLF